MGLGASRGGGHCSLVAPKRVSNEYYEDLSFLNTVMLCALIQKVVSMLVSIQVFLTYKSHRKM